MWSQVVRQDHSKPSSESPPEDGAGARSAALRDELAFEAIVPEPSLCPSYFLPPFYPATQPFKRKCAKLRVYDDLLLLLQW